MHSDYSYPNPNLTEKEIIMCQSNAQDSRERVVKLMVRLNIAEKKKSNKKNLAGIQRSIDKEVKSLLMLFRLNILPVELKDTYFDVIANDVLLIMKEKYYT